MFKTDYAVFLGNETDERRIDFIYCENLFVILSSTGSQNKEKSHEILKQLEQEVIDKKPQKLYEFEEILLRDLISHLPSGSSVSCGYAVNGILYLKSFGDGQVYLSRQNKLVKIISGDSSASGYIHQNDLIMLTTGSFFSLMAEEELKTHLKLDKPKSILDSLTPELKEKDDSGCIALFIHFEKIQDAEEEITEVEVLAENDITPVSPVVSFTKKISAYLDRIKDKANLKMPATTSKKITLVIVVILVVVLIWSVIFGLQRRQQARIEKLVTASDDIITQKLNEATDISILNLSRAQILLSEAKQELEKLKQEVKQPENEQIAQIEDKIAKYEKEIIKQEEQKPEVFYDLKLINDTAEASAMFKFKNSLVLLNSTKGEIYLIDIEKKSVEKTIDPVIKGSKLVALNSVGDIIFVNPSQGIFKIGDKKVTKVIDKDDQWSNLADFWIYNNNLYLVDDGKDEIYKYLVAENGFSGKTSYFKSGQAVKIDPPASIAIDTALYLVSGNRINKYLAGVRDQFSPDLPDDNYSFDAIFTDNETNKVYLLDKKNSKIYIMSKNGQYEKQIESGVIKSGLDFVVSEAQKSIYVLIKDKLYKLAI